MLSLLWVVLSRREMAHASARARANLEQCVVGMATDPAGTAELVQHHFPWLASVLANKSAASLNTRTSIASTSSHAVVLPKPEDRGDALILLLQGLGDPANHSELAAPAWIVTARLPDATARALEEWYQEETALYSFAEQVHNRQVDAARRAVLRSRR